MGSDGCTTSLAGCSARKRSKLPERQLGEEILLHLATCCPLEGHRPDAFTAPRSGRESRWSAGAERPLVHAGVMRHGRDPSPADLRENGWDDALAAERFPLQGASWSSRPSDGAE